VCTVVALGTTLPAAAVGGAVVDVTPPPAVVGLVEGTVVGAEGTVVGAEAFGLSTNVTAELSLRFAWSSSPLLFVECEVFTTCDAVAGSV
jgi:hypothetical protein